MIPAPSPVKHHEPSRLSLSLSLHPSLPLPPPPLLPSGLPHIR